MSEWFECEPHWARELLTHFHELAVGLSVALRRLEVKSNITHDLLGVIISDQDKLDADVAALVAAQTAIAQEISDLKNQPAAASVDFTGLDAAVAGFQGLVPAPPVTEPPVTEPPVVDPSAPVADTSVATA